MRKIWLLSLLFSLPVLPQSNPLRFQKITTEQGLPHNYAHSVIQDNRGFIWIGTNYGLARYDGYKFKIFQPNKDKPFSITHKPIGNLFIDCHNNLWMNINSGGMNKMSLETERFTGYFPNVNKKNAIGNETNVYFESIDSTLWIGNINGVFRYDAVKDSFIYALSKRKFQPTSEYVSDLTQDYKGNIWYIAGNQISILLNKSNDVISFGQFSKTHALDTIYYNSFYSSDGIVFWLTTAYNGLFCYNLKTNKLTQELNDVKFLTKAYQDKKGNIYVISTTPKNMLYVEKKEDIGKNNFSSYPILSKISTNVWLRIIEDSHEDIWIASPSGLTIFNISKGVSNFIQSKFNPFSISSNYIENIFIDRANNLWLCPYRKGINKADLSQKPFNIYAPDPDNPPGMEENKDIYAIYEDKDGNTFQGNTNNGITYFCKKYNRSYDIFLDITDPVVSIFEASDGTYWLGTLWNRTYVVKLPFITPVSPYKGLKFNILHTHDIIGVRKIVEDNSKSYWLATSNGIVEYQQNTNKFINHSQLYDSLYAASSSFYRFIYIDQNEIIWAGSNNGGLTRYDNKNKQFQHFTINPKDSNTIYSNTVYSIYDDKCGTLWIGTSQGLDKFDLQTSSFFHTGKANELPKRSVFSVFPDNSGNLWLSSEIGIIKYTIKSDKVSYYGSADGLENNEFNTTASFKNNTGIIYFGGTTGTIFFDPKTISPNPYPAKPLITNFYIYNRLLSPGDSLNGRILLQKQIWDTKKLELQYYENDFTIEFSALHFSAPANIKYQYKLEGYNNDWIYSNADKHFATFTGLPPGNYTFILKATNNDGLQCSDNDIVKLHIIISPPFWETYWFRIAVILLLIISVLIYLRVKLRSMKEANLKLDQKVKERTAELEKVNQSLELRTIDLEEANTQLEERQEEINLQKEEIMTQYETLESSNHILQEQQKKIVEQNAELDKHRNKLEFLVAERTIELEKALEKAEESDKLKTSFLTNMSHEIRTPMNAIIGFSNLLKDKSLSDNFDEFTGIIEHNGQALLTLINDILELSSIQSQQVSLKPMNSNLFLLLNKLLNKFKSQAESNSIELKINVGLINNNFHLQCDESHLLQVFNNLISNALKFTNVGSIEFGITEVNDKITFYVKDTGIGIPNNVGNSVFERFYKVERSNAKLFRGTGLGLALCKSIVELWKGEIWYDSEVDIGTTFYFTHPIATTNDQEFKYVRKETIKSFNLKGIQILIAEDEESNFKLLENYIKRANGAVLWAKNGLEAVKMAKENKISLILMDIKMPLLDGIDAALQIKQVFPQLPIIAQTAFAFKNEIEEILASGINDYITKPINKEELYHLICKYI